jgi:hypothetical protein
VYPEFPLPVVKQRPHEVTMHIAAFLPAVSYSFRLKIQITAVDTRVTGRVGESLQMFEHGSETSPYNIKEVSHVVVVVLYPFIVLQNIL